MCTNYACNKRDIRKRLDDYGWCVVPGVLRETHAQDLAARIRSDATQCHAHSPMMWMLRTHVQGRFREIWNDKDLISGFDGILHSTDRMPFSLPWHVDQDGSHCDGRVCLQAQIALTSVTPDSGGVCFLSGSHHHHARWTRDVKCDAWEYVPVRRRALDRLKTVCIEEFPLLNPGDLCIWDSRTVHRARRGRARGRERIVAFLSASPSKWASPLTQRQRRWAFEHDQASTHWPHRFVWRRSTEPSPIRKRRDIEHVPACVRALVVGGHAQPPRGTTTSGARKSAQASWQPYKRRATFADQSMARS